MALLNWPILQLDVEHDFSSGVKTALVYELLQGLHGIDMVGSRVALIVVGLMVQVSP